MSCSLILEAAEDTRITATEFRILAVISKGKSARADIAKCCSCSVPTVARAIAKLVKLNYLEREQNKGKASTLTLPSTRITGDTEITHDTTTRITHDTRIANDTGSRITHDTGIAHDTGQPVDNPPRACISTGARAETLNLNTRASDLIRSDLVAPPTKTMIDALIKRVGNSGDPTKGGLLHGGDLTRFLRAGCTWEDLEFAADKLAASFAGRGKRFSTWSLLEEHALEIRNRRVAGLPPPAPPSSFQRQPQRRNGPYRANGISPMVAVG